MHTNDRPGAVIVYLALFGLFAVIAVATPFLEWWLAILGWVSYAALFVWVLIRLIKTAH